MELTEAFDRVVLRHKLLIAVCVFLAISAALGLTFTAPKLYQANVRMVLDATDPTSETAAQGLADAAKGLATSPSSISQALHEVAISRDPVIVARRIAVAPLGSSGVLTLSVQDPDKVAVAQLAYALANQVIEARQNISRTSVDKVVSDLNGQIRTLGTSMEEISKQYDHITQQIATTDSSKTATIASLEAKQQDLISQRNDLASNTLALQSELTSVQSAATLSQSSSIVDKGTLTVKAVPTNIETNIALGILLGLLIGIALAGLRETLSPTVGGRVSLSRQAGAPFLGSVPAPRYAGDPKKVAVVAAHVQLAATNAGVSRVELLHVDEHVDLHPLANDLRAVLDSQHPRSKVDIAVVGDPQPVPASRTKTTRPQPALVLVSPIVVRQSAFQAVDDYLAMTGLDVVGITGYGKRQPRTRKSAPHEPKGVVVLEQAKDAPKSGRDDATSTEPTHVPSSEIPPDQKEAMSS